ncbi:T9SS type A sorting domain-containing protein [Roseivirga sp. BDSF3-8]|uniref:T9SS type A sorting domain-containing protein n=1 Tax=Roseivirga sp. BDSF3-8 TaxID=3241598 RepID=UPI003531F628
MRHHLPALRSMALAVLFTILSGAVAFAQQIIPLDSPSKTTDENAISIGGNAYDPGTILVGSVPANSGSKPVIVFIHGYTGDASTWFGDNDMYDLAYNAGYRTAFVTVYPDRSMWVNGDLFSQQLTAITNYYGVQKVVVVAHSKGGLDTDAALVHYGGYSRVNRVVTLGSPHWGSPLANLAQSGWVWWLSAVFGQVNEATYVMQTGYMDYFRSVTDPHVNNNYTDFRTVGGWDYGGSLWFSGVYLSANGGSSSKGGNDGVVNYRDSRRPSSRELYSGSGDSRTKYDHFELNIGSNFWSTVRSQLPSTLARESAGSLTAANENPHATVNSNMLVLASEGGMERFRIDNARGVTIEIRQPENASDQARIAGPFTGAMRNATTERKPAEATDILPGSVMRTQITNPENGEYFVEAEGPYLAIVTIEDNSLFELETGLTDNKLVYSAGESMELRVRLADNGGNPLSDATVSGMIRLTGSLEGDRNMDQAPAEVTFSSTGVPGEYVYISEPMTQAGIYNLSIDARKGDYTRSLVHSIGVTDRTAAPVGETMAEAFPNPFTDKVQIRFDLSMEADVTIRIRDIAGREVYKEQSMRSAGSQSLIWSPQASQPEGLYLYEIKAGEQVMKGKVILSR